MLKFIKHLGLIVLYFLASQVTSSFISLGIFKDQLAAELPAPIVEQSVWISGIIGIVLTTILAVVLWKVVYPRKTIAYTVESSWFHKLYWPILVYLVYFAIQFLIPVEESQNQMIVVQFVSAYPILAFFSVVVFAPILEELIFRGFLATYFFPKMQSMKTVGIYLIMSGLLFSLPHGPATIPQFLIYFTMGVNLGWIFLLKRDIRYSMVLHFVNNLIAYGMILGGV
ncbi:TPA: lysostaphin resistance A-like protein [Streptococcus suis]